MAGLCSVLVKIQGKQLKRFKKWDKVGAYSLLVDADHPVEHLLYIFGQNFFVCWKDGEKFVEIGPPLPNSRGRKP